jgi:hypothetical protein
MEYTYEASNISGNLWMIRRWKDKVNNPDDYTECQIIFPVAQDVIDAAIKQNSWA